MKKILKDILRYLEYFGETYQGRPVAFLWLCIFVAFILLSSLSPIKMARSLLFDEFQTIFPRKSNSQPVVIVDIDESTLAALGQWPWPRNYLAALIDSVNSNMPKAIGLDIIMPEADHASPQAIAESRPDLPEEVLDALINLPSNDKLLASSISSAPVVLGAAGFSYNTSTTLSGLLSREVKIKGSSPIPWISGYPYVLASLPEFQMASKGQGLLSNNPEKGVIRRASILSSVNNSVTPGLALEVMRVAFDAKNIVVTSDNHGINGVEIANKYFRLQSNGESWVYFDDQSRSRYISALSVLKNDVPLEKIKGKMVLIGLTGLGLQDMITSPFGDRRPGVEVHAQIIESFMDGKLLLRPWWMQWFELGLMIFGGILIIWIVPNSNINKDLIKFVRNKNILNFATHFKFINFDPIKNANDIYVEKRKLQRVGRIRPRVIATLIISLLIIFFGLGLILFYSKGLLFDSITPFVGLSTILVSLFLSATIEFEKQRKSTNNAFQNQRLKSAQLAGELNAARRIQLGTLPDSNTAFVGETRFHIEAMLEPARQVGGDLYDFFMIDESRLFFIIGDVAGKGLPACLYMVVSKALAKSAALSAGENIGSIISKANTEMTRENPEMLFVTGIAGILDLTNGKLEIVNAGHDAPLLISKDGCITKILGEGGPPLGIMDELQYPFESLQLSAGDTLLLLTDGVYEAMNNNEELYGTERILQVIAKQDLNQKLNILASNIREDVRQFVGETEPSDDLTLLLIRWKGPKDTLIDVS